MEQKEIDWLMSLENARCYLYLIESTSGHIKIGVSRNPVKRLEQLISTQGPFVYELIEIIPYVSRQAAEYSEKQYHKIFAKNRVNGEWFILMARDLMHLGTMLSRDWDEFRNGIDQYKENQDGR